MKLETERQVPQGDRAKNWRIALILCLIVAATVLFLLPANSDASPNDFAFYWTAARLVIDGRNPYSSQDTLDFQRRLPFAGKGPLVMLNPPWVLPLILPFGLLSFSTGKSLWLLLGLLSVFVSVHWLWDLYGAGENRWIAWLVMVSFLPVAVVLAIGQIGPLIVFGLAGFLRFEARHNEYRAGLFLFLAALKPHLFFLVWIALALCALVQRRWKPLAALLATLAGASLVTVITAHGAFRQYIELLGKEKAIFQETPTLGGLLRHISGIPALQYVPIAVAAVWFAVYWTRWRSNWEWRRRMPNLLLVSIATVSYAWFFDQVVLLPAVLYATALAIRSRKRLTPLVLGYLFINCLVLFLLLSHRTVFYYSWTALAWLILGAAVQRGLSQRREA